MAVAKLGIVPPVQPFSDAAIPMFVRQLATYVSKE